MQGGIESPSKLTTQRVISKSPPGTHPPEKYFTPKIALEICANICDIFKQEGAPTLDFEGRLHAASLETASKADDDLRKNLTPQISDRESDGKSSFRVCRSRENLFMSTLSMY